MPSSQRSIEPLSAPRRGGFTLVELMVVLIILAIAAAIVVPYAGSSSSQAVSAAQTAAADLQYAQSLSITTQVPTTVTYDANACRYTLSNQSGTLINPMTQQSYVVNFTAASGFGNVRMSSPVFGSNRSVTFDSTGAPDNAGSVTLQAGGNVYTVSVAAATGNVTVARVGG
jgi:type II secretion system protein H